MRLFCPLLLALVHHSASLEFPKYFNLAELSAPKYYNHETRRATQSLRFEPQPGKHVHLDYDVTHAADIINLDHLPQVRSVSCESSGKVIVHINASVADTFAPGTVLLPLLHSKLLTGGREWNCSFQSPGQLSTIMRRILHVAVSPSKLSVELQTQAAPWTEFFEHAKVKMHITAFPEPVVLHPKAEQPRHREMFEEYCDAVGLPSHMDHTSTKEKRVGGFADWVANVCNCT